MHQEQFNSIIEKLDLVISMLEPKKKRKHQVEADAKDFLTILEANKEVLRGRRMTADEIFAAIGFTSNSSHDRIAVSKAIGHLDWARKKRTNKGAMFHF